MSIEAWTVIGTGVALAVLNLGLITWLRSDMKHGADLSLSTGRRLRQMAAHSGTVC